MNARPRFVSVIAVSLTFACLLAATAAHAAGSVDEIEARVRQIYFEGYPITGNDQLDGAAVDRLGEMLLDSAEQMYWSNIVLALGASQNPRAYAHLARFAAERPQGEVSSSIYQARVALPVALGQLAHDHPLALRPLEEMARDAGSDPGWRFQSLHGESLAGSLRSSAITGLGVSGRPEAAALLSELKSQRRLAAGASVTARDDEMLRQLESAESLHARASANGPASVLAREPSGR